MSSKMITMALLLICSWSVSAQEGNRDIGNMPSGPGKPLPEAVTSDPLKIDVNEVYKGVQTKPEPGFNLAAYFSKNLKYPEEAMKNKIEGRVVVEFVVERDGSLSAFKVVRGKGLGHGIPEEAIRVMSIMPKWKPATQSGVIVRAYFNLPLDFKLP